MNDHEILILNPFNSNLRNQLIDTLSGLENVNYMNVTNIDDNLSISNVYPSLITVLLDKCSVNDARIKPLENLNERFPFTPILCFIDTRNKDCMKCLRCKKFSWSFIHTPIYSEDVKFIINWFLDGDDVKQTKSVEFSLKEHSLMDLFIGKSRSAITIKKKIISVASYDVTVLLQGETGTGKELCAKLLHYLSKRSNESFVVVNCGAIPTELFENELFGHKKGAYTDADTSEMGLINSANHGTLFLDEIENLPQSAQVKLLRFLEDKKYKPLGQSSLIESDVRIIAASNCNLKNLVSNGSFRDDLYYRLSVVNINLPPLRERSDDIPILAQFFVKKYSELHSKEVYGLRPSGIMHLMSHTWPGNIRELENMLQEAVVFNRSGWIEPEDLNFSKFGEFRKEKFGSFQKSKQRHIQNFEENYIKTVLKIFKGNISKASGFAQKDRREFYRLIKKHKIEPAKYR